MNAALSELLSTLALGDVQTFENMAVIPLTSSSSEGVEYITMQEAIGQGLLIVTEVDAQGSVPELKVINQAEIPVLVLDGEELIGAKQNRVLNTTILLKEKSETVVPVSCTEQGRWSHQSARFADSGVVLSSSLRTVNKRSVSESLGRTSRPSSDQSRLWAGISHLQAEARVESPTGAMKDVYEDKSEDIGDYLDGFSCVPGQRGLAALSGFSVM